METMDKSKVPQQWRTNNLSKVSMSSNPVSISDETVYDRHHALVLFAALTLEAGFILTWIAIRGFPNQAINQGTRLLRP